MPLAKIVTTPALKKKNKVSSSEEKVPFIEHLNEIRSRLMWITASILFGSIITYLFYPNVLDFLLRPLHQTLYYSTPAGGFNLTLQICILGGILFSIPVAVYHIYKFLQPLIPNSSRSLILIIVFSSTFFMALGFVFAYYISLPAALSFLMEYNSEQIQSLISANDYLAFISFYLLGFGLVFQIPLLMLFVNRIVKLDAKNLFKLNKWIILTSFVFAAVLTPTPDPVNQSILALPIVFLYNLSILIIWIKNRS